MRKLSLRKTIPILWILVIFATPAAASSGLPQEGVGAEALVEEVNKIREARGLQPLRIDPALTLAAQSHADYLAASGILSHFGEDGTRPYQRAIASGYTPAGDLTFGGMLSEAILSGSGLTVEDAVSLWGAEPRDLETMVSPDYVEVGAGMALDEDTAYFVLLAGRRSAGASEAPIPASTVPAGEEGSILILTSTPDANGDVQHLVRSEEALWNIAEAYQVSVDDIKRLNRLASDEIFEGQTLLIFEGELVTPAPLPTITVTLGMPTSGPTRPATGTATASPASTPVAPATVRSGGMTLGLILFTAVLAAAVGVWLGRKRTDENHPVENTSG